MPTIYEIGQTGYWTGAAEDIGDESGCPPGWTRETPPELGEGEYCRLEGWQWMVTNISPPVTQKLQSVAKLAFLRLLSETIGNERAQAIMTTGALLLIYAGAEKIDYVDVFIGIDGDPEALCYTAQLLAAGVVTQAEVEALEASWPMT